MATSYANPDGIGNRLGTIVTVSTFDEIIAGALTELVDGVTGGGPSFSAATRINNTKWVRWEFSTPRVIDEFTWYQGAGSLGTWHFEGGTNGEDFVVLHTFVLGAAVYAFSNTNAYKFYRLRCDVSSNANTAPSVREIEFKIDIGVIPAQLPLNYSYGNSGGSGDRASIITVTSNHSFSDGAGLPGFVDGDLRDAYATKFSGVWVADDYIRFDFGADNGRIIDALLWTQAGAFSHGTWKILGSYDASTWTELKSAFTLGGAINQEIVLSGAGQYRYYELRAVSPGVDTTTFLTEVLFRVLPAQAFFPESEGLFIDVEDALLDTVIESNIVVPLINAVFIPTGTVVLLYRVKLEGEGTPQMRVNGGAWVGSFGATLGIGDTLQLRVRSANTILTPRTVTVTIGALIGFPQEFGSGVEEWIVTTGSVFFSAGYSFPVLVGA